MNSPILQLQNSRLLKSDYQILECDDLWFTDSIIAVWFELMEKDLETESQSVNEVRNAK